MNHNICQLCCVGWFSRGAERCPSIVACQARRGEFLQAVCIVLLETICVSLHLWIAPAEQLSKVPYWRALTVDGGSVLSVVVVCRCGWWQAAWDFLKQYLTSPLFQLRSCRWQSNWQTVHNRVCVAFMIFLMLEIHLAQIYRAYKKMNPCLLYSF